MQWLIILRSNPRLQNPAPSWTPLRFWRMSRRWKRSARTRSGLVQWAMNAPGQRGWRYVKEATNQMKITFISAAAEEGNIFAKSAAFAVRNLQCWRNTSGEERFLPTDLSGHCHLHLTGSAFILDVVKAKNGQQIAFSHSSRFVYSWATPRVNIWIG